MESNSSIRADIIFRRTYARPLDDEGTEFETFADVINRVLRHQRNLWENAIGGPLHASGIVELAELRSLMIDRKVSASGRVLWLGGTEIVERRPASAFNCAFLNITTVHDVVDAFWLLLQGTGVGFRMIDGCLSGFSRRMAVEIIRSPRGEKEPRGREDNAESYDPETRTWTVSVGDSAEGWAKSVGKILAGKYPAERLVIDCSQIRGPGSRLKGYGWICQGDALLCNALEKICEILNLRAGKLLKKIDILDILNWLGTVLSNRRSAQIALMDHGDPEWREFANRKYAGFDAGPDWHRSQSNNSLVFHRKPTRRQFRELVDMMIANGGSEPGFVNASAARRRAPWWAGLNPCGEILLPDRGFCNLVEIALNKFRDDDGGLHRAAYLIGRANYRQTLVDLRDGILQESWHQNNQYLRLCGVGITGIAQRPDLPEYDYRMIRNSATAGAYSMADEIGAERPKAVTTVKPSGTLSKAVFDATEGAHKPKSRHIFNRVSISNFDPLIGKLSEAGYDLEPHPTDPGSTLAVLPVEYPGVRLDRAGGLELDREPAADQLRRYRQLMRDYVDHNVSITVSYSPDEAKAIVDEIAGHWDEFVSCSFLFRADPTMTAEQLGYSYLPQTAVTPEVFAEYAGRIRPIDMGEDRGFHHIDAGDECLTGACPVK